MNLECEVAVVGAGIVGAAVAAALAERNRRVAVFERGVAGSQGATRYTGGIVRRYDPNPHLEALSELADAQMRGSMHGRLFASRLKQTGALYLARDDDAFSASRLSNFGHPSGELVRLSPQEARRRYPFLSSIRCASVAYEPAAAVADARCTTTALLDFVRQHGTVLEHANVNNIKPDPRGGSIVTIGDLQIYAQVVVIAAGAWSTQLSRRISFEVRSIPFVRLRASCAIPLPIVNFANQAYVLPIEGNLVQVPSRIRTKADVPEHLTATSTEHIADARRGLEEITGNSENGPVFVNGFGYDGYPEDGMPIVGFVDEQAGVFAACGLAGIGYKLAPALAAIAAAAIDTYLGAAAPVWGDMPPSLSGYVSPQRFLNTSELSA